MPERALVIIDIQNDYFPGGKMELEGADAAAKAARAIAKFRDQRLPPRQGEKVVEKNFPNSFRGTDLDQALKESGTKELVVAGMMTHMCVDASVRQAADLGYKVTLLGDACATRTQTYGGESVPARQVHAAFLAALNGFYAKVITTDEL